MSVDQVAAARYLLKLKRASQSYRGFMDYYYPDIELAGFQTELIDVLDLLEKDQLVTPGGNPIRNVLINMPPRHGKTWISTQNFSPYLFGRRPFREVMISAYNAELAGTFGRAVRDIITDKQFLKAFPGLSLSKETRAVDFWKTGEGGAFYAVGLGGTTVGRGANILTVDDPYKSREEAESATTRRKVWSYYAASLLSRRQPDRDGQPPFQIVIMQRWHPDDLAGRIMESAEFKRGEWYHLNFKALTKKGRGVYVRRNELPADDPAFVPAVAETAKGKASKIITRAMNEADRFASSEKLVSLWPKRFPVKFLLQQRETIGEREFAALFQQEPYIVGGNLIKQHWFRTYDPEDLPIFSMMAFGVDTAFKTRSRNDYSVFTLGGLTEAGDIYILGVWRMKVEYPELRRQAIMLNARYRGNGLRGMWIEDAASGQSLIQELQKGSGITVLPWKPGTQDKVQKCSPVTPLMEAGRVYIPEEAHWLDDWMDELTKFPAGAHDDQVDSLVIVLDVLSKMIVSGDAMLNAPIGDFLKDKSLTSGLVFTGKPIAADPHGWQGGFGRELEKLDWAGWGL